MFEDSLFASSVQSHQRRGWAAIVSFSAQIALTALLIVVPMMFTDVLPLRAWKRMVEVPSAARSEQSETRLRPEHPRRYESNPKEAVIRVPSSIPHGVTKVVDLAPPGIAGGPPVISSTGPGAEGRSLISELLNSGRPIVPSVTKRWVTRWQVSGGVEQGLLIREVKPVYPALARQARVQGEVVLQAIIAKDGHIQNLRATRGNPLLIPAAVDAVKEWLYRPYLLNGEPVEVETQITVNFKLS